MNNRSKGIFRLHFPSLQLKGTLLLVALLLTGALCHTANGQNVEGRPVARMISSTPSYTRPRRVNPTPTAIEVAASVSNAGLDQANPVERRAFEETNLERVRNGLPPFAWDPELCRMARNHSENMARTGFFSHVTPEGLRLRDRARAVGISHHAVLGENIAYNLGYDDPGAFAVERWMMSPGHRKNILHTGFKAMAVGTAVGPDGAVFLTQTFITR